MCWLQARVADEHVLSPNADAADAGFEWSHVICCTDSNAQLRVCELHLSDMDLSGPLPALGESCVQFVAEVCCVC